MTRKKAKPKLANNSASQSKHLPADHDLHQVGSLTNHLLGGDISSCICMLDMSSRMELVADELLVWQDRSGNGNNASPIESTRRPSVNVNLPGLLFDDSALELPLITDYFRSDFRIVISLRFPSHSVDGPCALLSNGSFDSTSVYIDLYKDMLRWKVGNSELVSVDIKSIKGEWKTIDLVKQAATASLRIENLVSTCTHSMFRLENAKFLLGARTHCGHIVNYSKELLISGILMEVIKATPTN